VKVEKDRQLREGYRKLNEYNREVQKGVEYDTRRSNRANDHQNLALITENERISREYEICKQQLKAQTDRCDEYQRVHRADQEGISERKAKIGTAIDWAWDKLDTATKIWLEAIMFEKVARAEFLEALRTSSEPEILHAKAIHKSALKSTKSAQEHKDSIFEITLKMTELHGDEAKAKIESAYENLVRDYTLANPWSREREELEESNHKEYYERMKKTVVREEFDRAAELQNWFLSSDTPQDEDSESDSVRAEMAEKEKKEMELLEKKEAAKAKKVANKERLAKARAGKKEKKAAEAERLRVEAEKARKEKDRIEKREAAKAKKEAEKELAAKERAEKKAAKAAKAAKKDREEKAKRQTRAASQPVGVRKTRSSSKRPSPSLAQEGVAERVLEAVEEGSDDVEVVIKREPSLSPL
jgi:hypothetical protein